MVTKLRIKLIDYNFANLVILYENAKIFDDIFILVVYYLATLSNLPKLVCDI